MKVILCEETVKVFNGSKDQKLFNRIKTAQIELFENTIKPEKKLSNVRPIFIVGMPRSGTTLVEQIISAHSMVYGAGELKYIKNLGLCYLLAVITPNQETISNFRNEYLHAVDRLRRERPLLLIKCPIIFVLFL